MTDIVADGHFTSSGETAGLPLSNDLVRLASGGFLRLSSGSGGATAALYDASGQRLGQDIAFASVHSVASAVGLASGGFALAWTDFLDDGSRRIMTQAFDASGAALGAANAVATAAGFFVSGAELAAQADGSYVVGWTQQKNLGSEVDARFISANGTPLGDSFTAVPATAYGNDIASIILREIDTFSDGRMLFSFDESYYHPGSSSSDPYAGVGVDYYPRTTAYSGARMVNADGTSAATGTSSDNFVMEGDSIGSPVTGAATTLLSSGAILFTWLSRYGSSYSLQGIELDANHIYNGASFSIAAGSTYSVTALDHGAFAIAYTDTTNSHVFGQVFDGNALAIGGAFAVSGPDEAASMPLVTTVGSNDLAFLWNSGANSSALELFHLSSPLPSIDQVLTGTPDGDILTGHIGNDTISGNDGNDYISGGGGNDTIDGGAGNDLISGDAGNDTITAGDGMDSVAGGGGNDSISGGEGNDMLYGDQNSGASQADDGADTIHGDGGSDQLFGGGGDDLLFGDAGNDSLYGGSGSDTLHGGDGDDYLVGSDVYSQDASPDALFGDDGNDYLTVGYGDSADGGAGSDTVSINFYAAPAGVHLDLRPLDAHGTASNGSGTITNIEYVAGVVLTNFDDYLALSALPPSAGSPTFAVNVSGMDGNDHIDGSSAAEWIEGGAGDDVIFGGDGAMDSLFGGDGNDDLRSGSGGATISGGAGNDSVTGGSGVDHITGDAGDDTLSGGGGNDVIAGGDGNDVIAGGAGDDQIDGGAGSDIATFGVARAGATISVSRTGDIAVTSSEGSDVLHDIETIRFSDADVSVASLSIRGTSGNDTLTGTGSADAMFGLGGNDTLLGLGGDDVLNGGGGTDLLDGGDGFDRAIIGNYSSFSGVSATVNGDITIRAFDGTSILRNIEAVDLPDREVSITDIALLGTTADDLLVASADRQVLFGFDGNDVLNAGAHPSTLYGGDGNDRLIAGTAVSYLVGGDGADIFEGSAANLTGDTIADLRPEDTIHITDASLEGFTAFLDTQNLRFTGGSVGVSLPNFRTARLIVDADPAGGVDIRIVQRTAAHDFNGDGKSDILWRNGAGQLSDWLGKFTGTGGFVGNDANAFTNVPTSWHVAGTGDFNGDGRSDILWRSDSGQTSDWLGQLSGGFSANDGNALSTVPTSWHIASTGDFNGDGRSDILWRNDSGQMSDWLGQANGGFVTNDGNAFANVSTNWHIAGTGDFNGDGRVDILWRSDAGQLSDWLGQANGGFVGNDGNAFTGAPTSWHVAGTGDFNGDGRSDILWRSDSGQLSDWLGQANGSFVANDGNAFTTVSTNWHVVETGDYNGDGRDDILWRSDAGQLSNWLGQANGGFVGNDANAFTNVATNWATQAVHDLLV